MNDTVPGPPRNPTVSTPTPPIQMPPVGAVPPPPPHGPNPNQVPPGSQSHAGMPPIPPPHAAYGGYPTGQPRSPYYNTQYGHSTQPYHHQYQMYPYQYGPPPPMSAGHYRIPGPPGHYGQEPVGPPMQPNQTLGDPNINQYAGAPLPPQMPPHPEAPASIPPPTVAGNNPPHFDEDKGNLKIK